MSGESVPLLYLPALESLDLIAHGEVDPECDLDAVQRALETLSHLSASAGDSSDLTVVETAMFSFESEATAVPKKEHDRGFREYDEYFHVVRLSEHPVRTLTQSLLASYCNFLRQMETEHSISPTEKGILRSAVQNLAADLRENMQRKGEES